MLAVDRPTRGAVRLNDFAFDPNALAADLQTVEAVTPWQTCNHGDKWGKIDLCKDDYRLPVLDDCPAILKVLQTFDARVLDATLARLGPGGWVKEHRDISGGVPMGAVRFHIPIVTDPEVKFFVSGMRLYLAPGEVWNIDTTYRHKLSNDSDLWRVHLIVDYELNDHLRELLPARGIQDALHSASFAAICCYKAMLKVRNPKALGERILNVFRLRVLKKSSL